MRPKRNVPSHKVSRTQQPMRGSQVRRVEETQYAAVSGSSGSHRARATFDSAGGSSRGLSKGIPRRDLAPTLVDSLTRRPGATPGGSRSVGRTDTVFLATADQRSVFKKNVTSKFCPSLTCQPSIRSRVYYSDALRNRNTSLNGVPPDRTGNQHKSSARNISGRSQGLLSSTQGKCLSLKKRLSKKRHMIDISIKDSVSRVPSNDEMCLAAQLQNTLSMSGQAEESEVNVPEIHKYVASNIEQSPNETYSVTSYSNGTLPLELQESNSDHCSDENDSVEYVNEATSTTENYSLVEPSRLQIANTSQSTQKVQITPDDSPTGWERVLLSLQVQLSPLSSPSASLTAVQSKQRVSHNSCSTNRTFQTTSEILVLPIFARQRHSQRNWVSNKPYDTGLGPIGNALMKEILECKNYGIEKDNSMNVNQHTLSEKQRNSPTERKDKCLDSIPVALANHEQTSIGVCEIDFSATREMHENDRIYKQAFGQHSQIKVSNVDSVIKLQKDLTNPINSHKEDKHFSSENIVTELQLNQNDIVKMAYEIIDIVSKIHENRNTRSETSENIDTDLNAFRRGRSADLILKHSESNVPSARTSRSLKNFDTNARINVSETITESLKPLENGKRKWSSEEKSQNYLSSKVDTDAKDEVNGNAFKLPKALPILLYQNKQVQKILKHFVSKLEENDQRSRDPYIKPSEAILEVRKCSTEDEERKHEGNECDLNGESLLESKEQQFNEFIDLKEYQELGVQISDHTEKVDFSVNVCLSDNNAIATLNDKSVTYDESTASEVDTEKSLGVDSEAGAEDGDDEATASASESVEEQENTNIDSSNDPNETTICMCQEIENICPRHPAQNEEAIAEGTCQCERFQELCTESQVPIASTSQAESEKDTPLPDEADHDTKNERRISYTRGSLTFSEPKSGSWIPWVKESGSGPRIPDFNPSADPNIVDNVSSLTIPPHVVQNTMNLLENRDNELSVWGSGPHIPPWIPSDIRDDEVPDTITEFHWMPDGLRGFSSTIIYPEIPDDLQPYTAEERPLLCKPQSTPESSLSGLVMRTSPRKLSDTTNVVINPDAPAEVPHGAISASLDIAVGGTFFDVLANTMEKSISPLKSAIDDLKAKIDRLETAHIASMRPDILVGVTSVPTCSARSGQSNGSEEKGTTCVPPFGLYILHQRSSLAGNVVPLSATRGCAIENAAQKNYVPGKSPLPCDRCVDKMQTLSPSLTANSPNLVENSESLRPPTPFLASTETGGGGGGVNVPASSSVPEDLETVSEPQLPPSNGQMSDRCICKSLDKLQSSENVDQSLICPKCNKCSPSKILLNTPEACDTCCQPPGDGQEENVQSGAGVNKGIQNTSEHKVCVTCKTCISNVNSFDSNIAGVSRPSYVNIPCYQCCNGPVLRKMPRDYPWHRLKNCPGCAQCPYPPPCPPCPPPKPKLSPIAQMYLDMSRAKYDWSDMSERKKEDQYKKAQAEVDVYNPDYKPDEKSDGEADKASENYPEQQIDPENIEIDPDNIEIDPENIEIDPDNIEIDPENIEIDDSESHQEPEISILDDKEEETAQDFEKYAEESISAEAPKQDVDTAKGMEDKPNFPNAKFPCVCPRDYCIPPENLQCEETEPKKITDEELDFRKINHPCACPRDYCVPPEMSQQEHVEEPQQEENVPTEENVDSENIQNSSENLAPDPENHPT